MSKDDRRPAFQSKQTVWVFNTTRTPTTRPLRKNFTNFRCSGPMQELCAIDGGVQGILRNHAFCTIGLGTAASMAFEVSPSDYDKLKDLGWQEATQAY